MKKKVIAWLLAMALCGNLAACGGADQAGTETVSSGASEETGEAGRLQEETAESSVPDTGDAELQKAAALGMVPEALQGDYDAQITYREFCQTLDLLVALLNPEALEEWKQLSAGYREDEQPMTRMEGAIVMLYAARCAGFDTAGYEEAAFLDGKAAEGTDFYKDVAWDFPLLPDIHDKYYQDIFAQSEYEGWRCELDYREYARYFAEYTSYVSRKPYFDYDEGYNLRLADCFTRGDALRAALRFYETAAYFLYEPIGQLECTLEEETLQRAAAMPDASWQKLPDWNGYHFPITNEMVRSGRPLAYEQEEIQVIKEMGFNFVRVPLEFAYVFPETDTSLANRAFLESLDRLLTYAAEADIHVCFELHNTPGYTNDLNRDDDTLFWNPEEQQLFTDFWRLLAERYQKVPSNLLSFNLLNEPHSLTDKELTDDLYSSVMLQVIDAIRESAPDRLIFVDMLEISQCRPVYGLADAQIVQSAHTYFLLDGARQWPTHLIKGSVNTEGGPLYLQGSFPAGSSLDIGISGVQGNGSFTLLADDKTVGEFQLGGDALFENGCEYIAEEGTDEEWREYQTKHWSFTLPEDCTRLEIRQESGHWYQLSYLTVTTPEWETQITANPELEADYQHPLLTFDEHGTVTADQPERLVVQDKAWLEEMLRPLTTFREETGTLIMVQELGFNYTISSETACTVTEDYLSLLDQYQIPWACTCNSYGPVISKVEHTWRITEVGETPREGATYEPFMENWLVQKEYMEALKRHM